MATADLAKPSGNLTLSSSSFQDGAAIPEAFTMYGKNKVPSLAWSGAPAGTGSFALLVTDPDAMPVVGKEFVHWAVVDIPASATGIPEGGKLPAGSRTLQNDFGKEGYGGPQPPPGTGVHRYIFALYPLRAKTLGVKTGEPLAKLREAIRKEALDQAVITGTFEKK